jgi:hypothetical protein
MPRSKLLVACLLAAPSPAALLAQSIAQALVTADRQAAQLSSRSGFGTAARSTLSRSGILLWPGAPVVSGRADLERLLRLRPADSLHLVWQPLGISLSSDSTMGVTWGVTASSSGSAPSAPRLGRYIAVWTPGPEQRWTIAALVLIGAEDAGDHRSWPDLPLTRNAAQPAGPSAEFVSADLAFARLAADSGAASAFRKYAAEPALSFGGGGFLVRGPEAISAAVSGPARWSWQPVAAGAARDGSFGWTVGEAVISAPSGDSNYSKYLTVWTRSSDGTVRFLYDGGNSRPAD